MFSEVGHNFYSLSSHYLKVAKRRTLFAISVFIFLYAVIIFRLAYTMIINGKDGNSQNFAPPNIISRADILDRNGIVIATSLPTVSLFAYPHEIMDIDESVEKLATVLPEINKASLKRRYLRRKNFYG